MKAFKKIDQKKLAKIVGGADGYIPVIDVQRSVVSSAQASYIPVID